MIKKTIIKILFGCDDGCIYGSSRCAMAVDKICYPGTGNEIYFAGIRCIEPGGQPDR